MDDLISRDFIKSLGGECIAARDSKTHELLPISSIDALPSAQPEPQWIPCSERLPHGSWSDLVNVSIHDDSGDTPFDYTSCGWVTTDGEYWIVDNEINNHVIAWMPLPEPWRGEEHGTTL